METIKFWVENLLTKEGMNEGLIPYVSFVILLATTIALLLIGAYLTKIILRNTVGRIIKRSSNQWSTLLVKHKILDAFSLITVIIILKISVPLLFSKDLVTLDFIERLVDIYIVFVIIKIIISILKATEETLVISQLYVDKPISSYFQLARIILFIIAFILGLSILISKSPIYLLTAFGALSAVLLLIFKDTILGLVASIQISVNDMIRIGDWVEMPKFNADGDVISINLNTVKISNWDKTITTVPTYYFVTESFKNYRGMQNSGGRRISRSLRISINSVSFIDKEMREKFLQFELVKDYIIDKQDEIQEFNLSNKVDTSALINGRRMTNIGLFRIYIEKYLKNHPGVNQDMLLLARLKSPDEFGVPLQVYCFTSTVAFLEYETIQSDIFDHLLAAAPFFGLEVFQKPTGKDFQND